jgi:4-hydroxybenzoate polyprenyltransferase
MGALTLSLPIKDFKDIEGDRKYKIWTVPVLLGKEKGRMAVAVGVFTSFMMSVFMLNELRLFWWAIIFGGISFLIITNEKINPRNLFWWILSVVAVYGMILAKVIFIR